MKNIKIPDGELAEEAIRDHALVTFSGCRELRYEVSTSTFDSIWWRTKTAVGRGAAKPSLVLGCGRHHVTVLADDAVPAGEARCLTAADATMCEAAPNEPLASYGTFTHFDAAGKRTEHPRPRCDCGGILDAQPTIDAFVCRTCAKEISGHDHARAWQRIVESARAEAAPNLDGPGKEGA